ncbi:MAG: cell division protein FtsQ/DivIB [Propionibacteriaceae bacterium]
MSHGTSLRDRPAPGVADATEALRQRRRRTRRRLAMRVLIGVLGVALIGTAGWLVGFSAVLAADQVTVTGTQLVTVKTVTQTAAVPLGRPLARVDLDVIATRVKSLAPVKSVQVDRSWPHTVAITVTERTPAYVITGAAGYATLVDDQGVAFATVTERPADLVRASIPTDDPALLRSVAVVAQALPKPVRDKVDRIEASSPESIRLKLNGHREVIWGSADQSAVKGEVLAALIKKKAAVYDVSGPANPTTRG